MIYSSVFQIYEAKIKHHRYVERHFSSFLLILYKTREKEKKK